MNRIRKIRKHAVQAVWTAAVLAWAAEFTADAFSAPEHVWQSLLTLAGILTLAATLPTLLSVQVEERVDRHYAAITRGIIGLARPDDPAPTPPPWRALRSVPGGETPHGRAASQ